MSGRPIRNAAEIQTELEQINAKLDKQPSDDKLSGISWSLFLIIGLLCFMLWQGCNIDKVSPTPEPNPTPGPGPGPGPNPSPIGVIQLDGTEMQIYEFAIARMAGNTDAERRQSLNFLLGNISQKEEILRQFPNQVVQLLP